MRGNVTCRTAASEVEIPGPSPSGERPGLACQSDIASRRQESAVHGGAICRPRCLVVSAVRGRKKRKVKQKAITWMHQRQAPSTGGSVPELIDGEHGRRLRSVFSGKWAYCFLSFLRPYTHCPRIFCPTTLSDKKELRVVSLCQFLFAAPPTSPSRSYYRSSQAG